MGEHQSHILFADRDHGWSLPLRKQLRERGLAVTTAATARDLLDQARAAPPELVVLGEGLDELGSRFLAGLLQDSCPQTRIIRVLSVGTLRPQEPGPADNILFTTTRRTSIDEFVKVVEKVLGCSPRGTNSSKPPLVVCVDDEPLFLQSLARLMRRHGYRVLPYAQPELALEELPLCKPDLVILDVLMPGLNGFEMLDEIRRYYPASLPVVLLSALGEDDTLEEGRRLGAACYLTKPCIPEALLEVVDNLLRSPAGNEQAAEKDQGGSSSEGAARRTNGNSRHPGGGFEAQGGGE